MFTGIIQQLGKISNLQKKSGKFVFSVQSQFKKLQLGESISVNGVCLTVIAKQASSFTVEACGETLGKTTLGNLRAGECVNLERAMLVSDRFGGHFVQGHVDGIGKILKIAKGIYFFSAPKKVSKYFIPKGSVAVDGISLTLVEKTAKYFSCAILPYTLQHTALQYKRAGDFVNLEADLLAKLINTSRPPSPRLWRAPSLLGGI